MIGTVPDGWRVEKISEIFTLKQGKHLAVNDLHNVGYDVYGANGIIGKYDQYMYEDSKVLITCRGATCGSINISKPKSWITGNAIALISKKDYINDIYVAYFLKKDKLANVITGSAQPQIVVGSLSKKKIPIPPLPQQEKIVKVLDISSGLIEKQKELIENYDLFLKSKFIEMFGDIKNNPYSFDIEPLSKFGKIITGNTPPRKELENYDDEFIEWIKTDNISSRELYVSKAKEYLSEVGMSKGRVLEKDDLLVTCIAGSIKSIANVAMTDRKITFNQQINAIQPNKEINPLYLYWLIKLNKNYILTFATSSMKKMISKGVFQEIPFIKAPFDLQNKFSEIASKINDIKTKETQKLEHLETLHSSLMDKAFKGEIE